jgi:hypothetical protein
MIFCEFQKGNILGKKGTLLIKKGTLLIKKGTLLIKKGTLLKTYTCGKNPYFSRKIYLCKLNLYPCSLCSPPLSL